jgi:hypothetical protein
MPRRFSRPTVCRRVGIPFVRLAPRLALRSRTFGPARFLATLKTTLGIALRVALGIALGIALGFALGIVGRLRLLCGLLVFRIGYRPPVHGLFHGLCLRLRTYGVLPDGLLGTEPLWRTLLSLCWRTPLWVLPRRLSRVGVCRPGRLRLGVLRPGGCRLFVYRLFVCRLCGLVERGDLLAGRFRGLPLTMSLLVDRGWLLRLGP